MALASDSNREEWRRGANVSKYARRGGLLRPEEVWLAANGHRFVGARILDLGVGCGRTTPHLRELSNRYVAVDYSEEMIRCARRRWSEVDFRIGDARALELEDASFELVFFSFNGIDMVDRQDRARVLGEVRRVLVPRGTFFFSSHNLERPPARAYDPRQINFTAHPIKLAWRVARWSAGVAHHLRRRRDEIWAGEWAILNDKANNYRLMTYYCTPRLQREDLAAAGFILDGAIDADGVQIDVDHGSTAKFIYYSATKAA